MEGKIKVSIIVPTYNREESLINTLNCLLNQTYTDYEIIVVDQNEKTDEKITDLIEKNKEKD